MKKILLILGFLIFSFTSIAQSGFNTQRYYQHKYQITYQKVNNILYTEHDQLGNIRYYEIWRKAVWHQHSGTKTVYRWAYYNNQYRWTSEYRFGTYWYYTWRTFRRYFYVRNNRKFYY